MLLSVDIVKSFLSDWLKQRGVIRDNIQSNYLTQIRIGFVRTYLQLPGFNLLIQKRRGRGLV